MYIANELGVDEEVVLDWTADKLGRWLAFYKEKSRLESTKHG